MPDSFDCMLALDWLWDLMGVDARFMIFDYWYFNDMLLNDENFKLVNSFHITASQYQKKVELLNICLSCSFYKQRSHNTKIVGKPSGFQSKQKILALF